MRLAFWLSLLCIFLTFGCSPSMVHFAYTQHPPVNNAIRTVPVYLDVNFGNSDRLQISAAIENWNYALNGYVVLNIVSDTFDMGITDLSNIQTSHSIAILKTDSDNSMATPSSSDREVLAYTNELCGHYIYLVRDKLNEYSDQITQVVMHEIGHSLCLDHSEYETSIMHVPYIHAFQQCIDQYTIDDLANKLGVNPNKLNYCVYENN